MKGLRSLTLTVPALALGVFLAQMSVFAEDVEVSSNREDSAGHVMIGDTAGFSIDRVVAEALGDCNCPAPQQVPGCPPLQRPDPWIDPYARPDTPDQTPAPSPDQPPTPSPMSQTPNFPQLGFRQSMDRVPGMVGDFFGSGSSTITIGSGSIIGRTSFPLTYSFQSTTLNEYNMRARLYINNNGPTSPLDSSSDFMAVDQAFNAAASNSFTYDIGSNSTTNAIGNNRQSAINNLQPGQTIPNSGGLVVAPGGANAAVTYGTGTATFDPNQSQPINGGRSLQTQQAPGPGGAVDNFTSALGYTATVDSLNSAPIEISVPSPSVGGASVGRMKLAENASPIPRDRIFLNYSYFDDVKLQRGGVNVNRFTPGFEKTFFDGLASLEVRVPIAATLDSTTSLDSSQPGGAVNLTNTSNIELGNLTMWLKALIHRSDTFAVSTGLGFTVPTADDVRVRLYDGISTNDLIQIENRSVHLLPFIGAVCAPNDRFFYQGILQFDFDANGNPVDLNQTDPNNNNSLTGLARSGRINDNAFLYLDLGAGYWFHKADSPYETGLTGMTGLLELHYNASLQETDVVQNQNFRVGNFQDNVQVVNAVVGTSFEFDFDKTATIAYVIPLEHGADRQFDGELRLFFNWFFGRRDRLSRPVF